MRSLHHHATPTFPEGPAMTDSRTHNGQIPTDPNTVLLAALAIIAAAGQLTSEQSAALESAGNLAELVLALWVALAGRR